MINRRTLKQSAAQTMLLNASTNETFIIRLRTSIQLLNVERVSPGQLYVFVLLQDSEGGHRLTWGANTLNATAINPAPHSITVQCFIGSDDGIMRANAPGTWA
jgi:hypothetical protein